MKRFLATFLALVCFSLFSLCGCENSNDNGISNDLSSKGESNEGSAGDKVTGSDIPEWDGKSVTYDATAISKFGSGTPFGFADLDEENDVAVIVNTDTSLDNYGGVQTPLLLLDFSKAVTFRMQVTDCHTQYIVKLTVAGESESYYVLSDESKTGEISVNVVDSMLSEKYRVRNTQPDPGYRSGWKYDGQKKNCNFYILAKGPEGESQTAELKVKKISVYNNETAVTDVSIQSEVIKDNKISVNKGDGNVSLKATVSPSSVKDDSIIWESLNESVAEVDGNGTLRFTGVGKTYVIATSAIDQTKSDQVEVNVLSGYENVNALKEKLSSLTLGRSEESVNDFTDIFKTTWDSESEMTLSITLGNNLSARMRSVGVDNSIYNYFDGDAAKVSEADRLASGDTSYLTLNLSSVSRAEVYRLANGELSKSSVNGSVKAEYLEKSEGAWERINSYEALYVIVRADGSVKKAKLNVISCSRLENFVAADYADASKWTVPDRSKQKEDGVAHALSPASVKVEGDTAIIKQNKYPESKYCFGGILSNRIDNEEGGKVEIVLDVRSVNKKSDFVKTMWEVRILYYEEKEGGVYKAVSKNPIKITSGNEAGVYAFEFEPAYDHFRLYLVVNGSDIGEQFDGAEMKIGEMQIYSLD